MIRIKKCVLNKYFLIFFTCMILIIGNSKFLVKIEISSYIEYFGYFILLCGIWLAFLKKIVFDLIMKRMVNKTDRSQILFFIIIMIMFSIGIMMNTLSFFTKLRLILTMFTIASAALMSGDYIDSYRAMRSASYGILFGTIITMCLSFIGGISLMEVSYEGLLNKGFNGGVQFKNFYAVDMLACFMGIYFYYKNICKTKKDLIILILLPVLILLSSSRGGYVLFALFFLGMNCDKLSKLGIFDILSKLVKWKKVIIIVVITLVMGIVSIFTYYRFAFNSETYLFRVRGVLNYINYYRDDLFHLWFGNSEMAFGPSELTYTLNIRSIVGWDGSLEMGFLNILIKNGIIGIVGYILCYLKIFISAIKSKNRNSKVGCVVVLLVLLISSLVESYICNIHALFGIYCYLIMACFCKMSYLHNASEKNETRKVDIPL